MRIPKATLPAPLLLAVVLLTGAATAKEQKQGEAFDKTGTVTKHGVDNCMEGNVQFDLYAAGAKRADWLSPKSRMDIKVLGDAVKSGGTVHVIGTRKQGLRPDCAYVETTKCEPVETNKTSSR